jgi:hypothetical protein
MRHRQLRNDERASQIDINRIIPFLDVNLEDIAHTLSISCVGDDNFGVMAMLLFDLVEESLQVAFFADITLVG